MYKLSDWLRILQELVDNSPEYQVDYNGDRKGVAITFRNKKTPQLITVYPHKEINAGIVIRYKYFQNDSVQDLLASYRSKRETKPDLPHYLEVPDDLIINVVRDLLADKAKQPSYSLDYTLLDLAMKWLMSFVIENQSDSEVSFDKGILLEEEGYKKEIFRRAHSVLEYNKWTKDLIGSGKIIEKVIQGFQQKSDKKFNNIVQFQNLTEFHRIALSNMKTAEEILYHLYVDDNPQDAFDKACELWGRRYPELTYLLFMKDMDKYIPVKTDNHRSRFKKLNIQTDCMTYCSWKNYSTFIAIHEEIRKELETYLGMDVSLIDAHSFVWMIHHAPDGFVGEDTEVCSEVLESDDPLESFVVSEGKEGKKVARYVTKYERKPKNRNAAIKIHGYKCMACNFEYEKFYGEIGKDFIEVHHVKPLYSLEQEEEINPETDLVCLCANCHRMIHKKRGSIMTVDELKGVIQRHREE